MYVYVISNFSFYLIKRFNSSYNLIECFWEESENMNVTFGNGKHPYMNVSDNFEKLIDKFFLLTLNCNSN